MSFKNQDLAYESYVPHYVKRRIAFHLCHTAHHLVEGNEKVFATLLFADISGFTRLASRLNAEDLKYYINDYFSIMLNVIDRFGGDVVKFCGDAVIIMWHVPSSGSITAREACVLKAGLCALQLIESCGDYSKPMVGKDGGGMLGATFMCTESSSTSTRASHETRDVVELSLHCGISSGIINCMILGNENRREFIISGLPLDSMGKAEASAGRNEVCVTSDCKVVLERYFIVDSVVIGSEMSSFCKLKGQLKDHGRKSGNGNNITNASMSSPTRKPSVLSIPAISASHLVSRSMSLFQRIPRGDFPEELDGNGEVTAPLTVADIVHLFSTSPDSVLREVGKYDLSFPLFHRDCHKIQSSMQFQSALRSFVHQTVLSAVESHTYALLSEMRNVVTVFVGLHGLEASLEQGMFDDVQEIFLLLMTTVELHNGSLRQFVVDDKGCVSIVCFGLFGCSTTNNALNALKFSVDFQQLVQQKQLTLCVGVAAGRVYCGNVGSINRCEFAVMGASVNLAARLMSACKVNGQFILVTEDIQMETSSTHEFVPMSSIMAKGYDQPINVYAPIVAKRSFGRAVILTAGPGKGNSSPRESDPTTVNKFLKTIQQLNDSYVQQLRPDGTEFERKGNMNKVLFDLSEGKFFPPEVEKNILLLRDKIRYSRGVSGNEYEVFSSALVCGHSGSGKTALLQRLCYDLLDQRLSKSKIIFINGNQIRKVPYTKEPYSLIRDLFRLLVWDTDCEDDHTVALSRFEAAALKVESYSHSSSDVLLDFEEYDIGYRSNINDPAILYAQKSDISMVNKRLNDLDCGAAINISNSSKKEIHTSDFSSSNQYLSLRRKKDLRIFSTIQGICDDNLNTLMQFSVFVTNSEFERLSLIESMDLLLENTSDNVSSGVNLKFVDKMLQVLCGSHNLVDFMYSFLYESLQIRTTSTQMIDGIFIMILLILFGVFPSGYEKQSKVILPRLITLIDDIDSADASSLRVIAELIKHLRCRSQQDCQSDIGCIIMTGTLSESLCQLDDLSIFPGVDRNVNSMITRKVMGRMKQDKSKSQPNHSPFTIGDCTIFQLFETECQHRIPMAKFSTASIQGLLHACLGDRRWEWLLRKVTGLLKNDNSTTFGRRHGFVAEHLSYNIHIDSSNEINNLREREILRKSNNEIVADIFAITNSGTPSMVYEILSSLRHAIDRGIFISIKDLPILRQRKEKILEWLDGLNGSELAILKAASVVGGKFSVDLLRKGLMSLDMEYCCADMVLNSTLLRLRRIGILRKSSDDVSVTNCSSKCEVFDYKMEEEYGDGFQFEFVDDSIRIAIYNLMLDSQKAAVHCAIASYYEVGCGSSKIFSRWYPIFQHYMKSNAADKMTEYSWKLLQYNVSGNRYFDVIQVCGVLLSLLGAPKERVLIKQAANNFEKQFEKLPFFRFYVKQPSNSGSTMKLLTQKIVRLRKSDDVRNIVLEDLNKLFTWEVRQPISSFSLLSSPVDAPSKRSHRRSSTSIRSVYWPNIGWSNRVAVDSSTGMDKEAKEELRQVDYRCGLVHHFSKGLTAHHLFASSWDRNNMMKGKSTQFMFLSAKFTFKAEILDLVMVATVVEQLSHAYMCLGHCVKSEDCSALALCLLQHNRNLEQDKKKLNKMFNVTVPESTSLKEINMPASFSKQEVDIEVKCKLRLAVLGIFRGDIATSILLLRCLEDHSIRKTSLLSWALRITGSQTSGHSEDIIPLSNRLPFDRDEFSTFRSAMVESDDDGCSGKGCARNQWNELDSDCMHVSLFRGLTCLADSKLHEAVTHFITFGNCCDLLNNMTMKVVASVFLCWCHILRGNFNDADSVINEIKFPLIMKHSQTTFGATHDNEWEEFSLSKSCSIEILNLEHLVATFRAVFVSPTVMGRLKHVHDASTASPLVTTTISLNLLRGCIGHHEWSSQCYDMFRIIMQPSSDLEEALLTTKSTLPLLAYYLGGKYPLQLESNGKVKMALQAFHFRYFLRPILLVSESEKDFAEYHAGSNDGGSSFFPSSPLFHIVAFMIIFASCRLLHHQIDMVNSNTPSSRLNSTRSAWYEDMEAINIESLITIMFAIAAFDRAYSQSFPILKSFSLVLHVQLQLLLHSIKDFTVYEFLARSILPQIVELPNGIHTSWKFKSRWRRFFCYLNIRSQRSAQKYIRSKGCSYAIDFLRHLGDFLDINTVGRDENEKVSIWSADSTSYSISEQYLSKQFQFQQQDINGETSNSWFGKWMIQWQYEELRHLLHNTDSTS